MADRATRFTAREYRVTRLRHRELQSASGEFRTSIDPTNDGVTLLREMRAAYPDQGYRIVQIAEVEHVLLVADEAVMPSHVSEYISLALHFRRWTRDDLALRMTERPGALDFGVNRLALDLLMDTRELGCVLGGQAVDLEFALEVPAETWVRWHETWKAAVRSVA